MPQPSAAGSARLDYDGVDGDARRDPWEVIALLRQIPPYTHRRLIEVADRTGYALGSVSSLAWLADHVPAHVQRADVPLKAHYAVAKLPVAEQRRRLAEAAIEGLSASLLRERIAAEASP